MALEVNQRSVALTRNEAIFFSHFLAWFKLLFQVLQFFVVLQFTCSQQLCVLSTDIALNNYLWISSSHTTALCSAALKCLDQTAAHCVQTGACTEHSKVNVLLALPSVLSNAHLILWFSTWCPSSPILCDASFSDSFCWNAREHNWQSPNVIYLKDFLTEKVISQRVFKAKRTLPVTEESRSLSTIFLQSECN